MKSKIKEAPLFDGLHNAVITLRKNGYVCGIDYPFSGMSSGNIQKDSYKDIPLIIDRIIKNLLLQRDIKNINFLCESFGSMIVLSYLKEYSYDNELFKIKELIFAPGIFYVKEFNNILLVILLFLLNKIAPLKKIKNYRKVEFYSDDEEKIIFVNNDDKFRRNFMINELYWIYRYYKQALKELRKINISIRILHGNNDHYCTEKKLKYWINLLKENKNIKFEILESCNHWILINEMGIAHVMSLINRFQES